MKETVPITSNFKNLRVYERNSFNDAQSDNALKPHRCSRITVILFINIKGSLDDEIFQK